jgi:integrase
MAEPKTRKPKGEGSFFKTAAGKYRGYVTVDGKRKYFTAATAAEAAQKLRTLTTQKERGIVATGKTPTLADWMQQWLASADLKPGTAAAYEHNLTHYIAPHIGHHRLTDLKPEHLELFYKELAAGKHSRVRMVEEMIGGKKVRRKMQAPLSARTIGNVHANIRRALNVAMQRGHVYRNVALMITPPRKPKPATTSFSAADARRILEVASEDRYAARWHLALMYGLRPSEALGITWPAVDLNRKTIAVGRQLQNVRGKGLMMIDHAKTAAGDRIIHIPDLIVEQLKRTRAQQLQDRLDHDDYVEWEYEGHPVALVFTQPNGKPLYGKLDGERWKELLDKAGLPHARRYQARHTAASLMIDMGVDVSVVASTLGHSNTSFTYDTYVHPLEQRKRDLADLMGDFAR